MNSPFNNVFAGKSVFVTGHTGFKGSWLCLWLERLGAKVTGYSLAPPTNPNNFAVSKVRDVLVDHYEGDIRDEAILHPAMKKANPDVVLHLAAQTVVRESYRIPRETFDINVMGTAGVLEGVRHLEKPCAVVCVTSDKCYENREQIWGYRETDSFGGHDPYSGSKGAAEILIHSYRHSFFPPEHFSEHGIKLASARGGNVIGGGDWTDDALIVDLVKSLSQGQPIPIRSPQSYRPWQHVLPALSGYLTLAARLVESDDAEFCSGWNFGPLSGNELSVREVVEYFIQEWGSGSWIDASDPHQPHEATLLHLAIDKAVSKLGWKPGWNVFEALRRTANWYQCYLEEPQMIPQINQQQIAAYENTFVRNGQIASGNQPADQSSLPIGQV